MNESKPRSNSMTSETTNTLDTTTGPGVSSPGVGDADLLRWYFSDRDDAAFESLIRRHGPMVLGVCHRVLGDSHAAEDAFQATFLVLAQRTRSIDSPHRLAQWLHGVARRTALAELRKGRKRTQHEQRAADMRQNWMIPDDSLREFREILDEEIEQLPTRLRLPLILFHLQGMTTGEAARHLGAPKGTVESRLAQARELLRGRLSRRGVVLTLALVMLMLEAEAASAAVSEGLVEATVTMARSAAPPATYTRPNRLWVLPLAIVLFLTAGTGVGMTWNSWNSEVTAAAAESGNAMPERPPNTKADCHSFNSAASLGARDSESESCTSCQLPRSPTEVK